MYIQQWLTFPSDVREKLHEIFSLTKSVPTYVEDNVVKSDGHSDKDLELVNVDLLKEFNETDETDMQNLMNMTVVKVKSMLYVPPEPVIQQPVQVTLNATISPNEFTKIMDEVKAMPEIVMPPPNEQIKEIIVEQPEVAPKRRGRPPKQTL